MNKNIVLLKILLYNFTYARISQSEIIPYLTNKIICEVGRIKTHKKKKKITRGADIFEKKKEKEKISQTYDICELSYKKFNESFRYFGYIT